MGHRVSARDIATNYDRAIDAALDHFETGTMSASDAAAFAVQTFNLAPSDIAMISVLVREIDDIIQFA
jgi:hypothetical protein